MKDPILLTVSPELCKTGEKGYVHDPEKRKANLAPIKAMQILKDWSNWFDQAVQNAPCEADPYLRARCQLSVAYKTVWPIYTDTQHRRLRNQ